jgi:hypothetical protein
VKRPVTLGPVSFASLGDALLHVRGLLHATPHEVDLEGEALALIEALYATHPSPEVVAVRFVVGMNYINGTPSNGFHAVAADGARHRFTYKIGPLTGPRGRLGLSSPVATLRMAIMDSQRAVKQAYYNGFDIMPCQRCGDPITRQGAHVDHEDPKFRDIAEAWFALYGEPPLLATPGGIGEDFRDPGLKREWIMFHDLHAAIRVVVCPPCNAAAERRS